MGYIQALPVAIDEGLEQWLVVGDGLQYVPIISHITDGPLAQPSTTQSEDVAVRDGGRTYQHGSQAAKQSVHPFLDELNLHF